MIQKPIVILGDPHGDYEPIHKFCSNHSDNVGTLILIGDQDLTEPLDEVLTVEIKSGWDIRWIHGNHDCDSLIYYQNLFSHSGSISGLVYTVDNLRIAGLGGVFRGKVWDGISEPRFATRKLYVDQIKPNERFQQGLPLRHRASIFFEDFERLSEQKADVLISHEAPSSHQFGYKAIDDLAEKMGCKLIVHGHHHWSYQSKLDNKIDVIGLSINQTINLWDYICL